MLFIVDVDMKYYKSTKLWWKNLNIKHDKSSICIGSDEYIKFV